MESDGDFRALLEAARKSAATLATAAARAIAAEEVQEVKRALAQKEAECESLRSTLRSICELAHCPIQQSICREPVVASDGYSYERQAIERWRCRSRERCLSPMTRDRLEEQLYPNRFLAEVCHLLTQLGLVPDVDSTAAEEKEDLEEEEPDVAEWEIGLLQDAITRHDEAAALSLLMMPELPELNRLDWDGSSLLHKAVTERLSEVALAILSRPDFRRVNAKTTQQQTALHLAAGSGSLSVCAALVHRSDFSELRAVDLFGQTALQVAREQRLENVAELLERAERDLR